MTTAKRTTHQIQASDLSETEPEFVRIPYLNRQAGIKRGLAYRKIRDGTFKSVLIREPGNKSGIRLVFWASVKEYLHKLMAEQAGTSKTDDRARSSREDQ